MTANGILQIALYLLLIVLVAKPMGAFMTKVFAGERTFLHPLLRPVEAVIYKVCGIDETGRTEMDEVRRRGSDCQPGEPVVYLPVCCAYSSGSHGIRRGCPMWVRTWRSIRRRVSPRIQTGRRTRRRPP